MQKILLTGLLILLLAVPAPAAEKEVAGVFFTLPEGWSVVADDFHLAAPAGRPPDGHRRDGGRRCGPCPRPDSDGTGLRDRSHGRSCGAGGTVQLPHQERRSGWRLFSGAVQRTIHPGQRAGRAAPGRAPAGRHALPGRSRPCAALIFPCPENGKRPCAATGTFFYGSLPERAVPRPEQMLPSAHGSHGTGIVRLSLFQESQLLGAVRPRGRRGRGLYA